MLLNVKMGDLLRSDGYYFDKKVKKILVIGQTPPPFAGQAMMIQRLVNANYPDIEIHHVRMAFSGNAKTIGRFRFRKIFHMFYIVSAALRLRLKHKISALYYPPAGPNLVPILRDLFILSLVRPFFRKTVFHFRAAGISDYLNERSWLKRLAKYVYQTPDISIQLSNLNPADGEYFDLSKRIEKVMSYLNRRIPTLGKKVELVNDISPNIKIRANGTLLSWAIENLIRNSIDSIDVDLLNFILLFQQFFNVCYKTC